MLDIFVDADGCPVKAEIYRVAKRYGLEVTLVSNQWMQTPDATWLRLVVVAEGANVADDWIVEHVNERDIVITGDIPLASRCLKKGARVLGLKGRPFTEDNIGGVVATRDLLTYLRDHGAKTGGPAPFDKRDRSRFLEKLDEMVQVIRRESIG